MGSPTTPGPQAMGVTSLCRTTKGTRNVTTHRKVAIFLLYSSTLFNGSQKTEFSAEHGEASEHFLFSLRG